jgi:hypothetical protein
MTTSIAILVLTALRTENRTNRVKDVSNMDRLPSISEKEDHQRGKIDIESIYIATERLVTVGVAFKSTAS